MSRTIRVVTVTTVLALTLLAAACGDDTQPVVSNGSGAGNGESPGGSDANGDQTALTPVLTVEHSGGFTTIEQNFQTLPALVIYDDGLLIQLGPQILIYPGPALPALLQATASPAALASLEDAAREAGLDREIDYGHTMTADAGTTTVTVRIDGENYIHQADALGMGADEGLTPEQIESRERLQEFIGLATNLRGEVGASEVSEQEPYESQRFRLWVRPAAEVDEGVQPDIDEPEPTTVAWTVEDVPLETSDCIAVEGSSAKAVAELFADANTLTRFEADGETWAVVPRPVLPHEPTCPG